MEGEDEMTGSCADDRQLPLICTSKPHQHLVSVVPQTQQLLLSQVTPARLQHTDQPLGTLELRGCLVHVQSGQEIGHSFTEVLLSDLSWWVQE